MSRGKCKHAFFFLAGFFGSGSVDWFGCVRCAIFNFSYKLPYRTLYIEDLYHFWEMVHPTIEKPLEIKAFSWVGYFFAKTLDKRVFLYFAEFSPLTPPSLPLQYPPPTGNRQRRKWPDQQGKPALQALKTGQRQPFTNYLHLIMILFYIYYWQVSVKSL